MNKEQRKKEIQEMVEYLQDERFIKLAYGFTRRLYREEFIKNERVTDFSK